MSARLARSRDPEDRADWLTSAWDQNAALYACAPAEAVVEEVCGGWLKDLLGLPAHASFALVTGTQMGHATALAAAHAILLQERVPQNACPVNPILRNPAPPAAAKSR